MTLLAPALTLLALLSTPALAAGTTPAGPRESAVGGFTVTFVVLLVGATVFALVWRAVSKRREAAATRSPGGPR